VDLYIQSPIRLHGVVFNWLSTRTTLPFYLYDIFNVKTVQIFFFANLVAFMKSHITDMSINKVELY
jgi:hypothetical protein